MGEIIFQGTLAFNWLYLIAPPQRLSALSGGCSATDGAPQPPACRRVRASPYLSFVRCLAPPALRQVKEKHRASADVRKRF